MYYRSTDKNRIRLQYVFEAGSDLLECKLSYQGKYRSTPLFNISREGWSNYKECFDNDVRHAEAFSALKKHLEGRSDALLKDKDTDPTKTLVKEIKSILPNKSLHDLEAFAFEKSIYFKGESLSIYEKLFREATGLKEDEYDMSVTFVEVVFYTSDNEFTMRSDRILRKNLLKACEEMDPRYIDTTNSYIWDEVMEDPGVVLEELLPAIIKTWKKCRKYITMGSDALIDYLQDINHVRPIEEAECYNIMGVIVLAYLQCYSIESCVDEYIDLWRNSTVPRVLSYHGVEYYLESLEDF